MKTIMNDAGKRSEAVKEAQLYIKQNITGLCFYNNNNDERQQPWDQQTDDLFFSRRRRGLVSWWIPTGSPIYYEFEGFYKKLQQTIPSNRSSTKQQQQMDPQQQSEVMRHALVLFYDFQEKKQSSLRKKLDQNREALPITPFANAIVHTLKEHRLLLIAGDTGCGKSTQVPQILMKAGFQKIACTQPRRIACSSLAKRVSYETMNEYGSEIAYQVRFEGTKTRRTRTLFLTEGLLLRQYAMDQSLSMYDVIVVDEVHERHMMGDFLLALLKRLIQARKDLYVVLMSATINADLFANYFDAPTLKVPGKMYDVKIHYWNHHRHEDKRLVDDAAYEKRQSSIIKESIPSRSERMNAAPYLNIMAHIDETIPTNERGDLLIFLSGINEIMALEQELKIYAEKTRKWIILILHSSVAVDDQEKIFDIPPQGIRKCIISSNIAETSVTIDGIRFIVDSGKVKESSHEATTNRKKLSEFWISKASAKQRAGRAGRTGPGECYRLYSENEYLHLNDYSVPEIQRGALEPIVLNIKALQLGDPRNFDYLEAPSAMAIEASVTCLQNLGALDEMESITNLGTALSNLPVDAVIGKMILLGYVLCVENPILTLVACMSVQSPFVHLSVDNPSNTQVLKNQKSFDSRHGDPFTLLNVWQAWLGIKNDRKRSSRQWCRQHGIEEQRLYEITKIRGQFEKILKDFQPEKEEDSDDDMEYNNAETRQSRYLQRDQLKRERFGQRSQKKRRILSMNQGYNGDNDDDDRVDIRALEFSMGNNLKRLERRATLNMSDDHTIQLLKLIICSSLYPQFAIGDDHNPYRKSDELVFHAPVAGFLSLHPTSTMAHHPDWIRESKENTRKDDLEVEQGIQNQLLCYLQLLETSKPYLLSMIRVPGIQALLLFSKQLDTNEDCSVIVADSFYVIQFKTSAVAQHVLRLAYKLRTEWERLFNQKLGEGADRTMDKDHVRSSIPSLITPSVRKFLPIPIQDILDDQELETEQIEFWTPDVEAAFQLKVQSLSDKLVTFMTTSTSAELTMGKASQFMKMFTHYRSETEQGIPRSWNPKDVIRKGVQITPHLWYNSLDIPSCSSTLPLDIDNKIPDSVKMYWYCQQCDNTLTIRKSQLLEHVASCHPYIS
ncbi:putative ATP-dependent RNA helicase DHX34-like protein [Halteromyces radiatus]|uniref:putative ATP-dependent RNA helicase DHX34-like protein n=1 Tax=Halteromyces radiatus TaxID=101107 RepID=UPI00221F544B|nr:putative ATP-dependent RNA helicase DHX34-like protein [Halteromyces radiatus]KAI8092632.1 putative ATP-dependent RNA helicase DHX34-like protein [Halteromyces radiatus]